MHLYRLSLGQLQNSRRAHNPNYKDQQGRIILAVGEAEASGPGPR